MDWIYQLDLSHYLLIISSLTLILLVFIAIKNGRNQQIDILQVTIAELANQLDKIHSQFHESQQRQLSNIAADREKQLTSLADFKLAIETRLSKHDMSFNRELHEFKTRLTEGFEQLKHSSSATISEGQLQVVSQLNQFESKLNQFFGKQQLQLKELIEKQIRQGMLDLRLDIKQNNEQQNLSMTQSIKQLTENTDNRLKEISGQVEKRLADGFDKTTQTFNDVLKRLALIDDAQKKITELSSNVVSLQEILNDKRSRGAFGEVQLKSLISNIMPASHYQMQQTLSNNKIADCVLLLPPPTGKVAIDAKFPLESYRIMTDISVAEVDRKQASKQFERDIKKHINDISSKYILPPETSDGAVMFIPAESVFAEIHGHFPALVEYAYQQKVWMVSPTTLMAILTTAATVIKDEQTRQQVHIIKEHLSALGRDFVRFQSRMENLSKHIGQVTKDVEQVHVSARKISSRFSKIEKVELKQEDDLQP